MFERSLLEDLLHLVGRENLYQPFTPLELERHSADRFVCTVEDQFDSVVAYYTALEGNLQDRPSTLDFFADECSLGLSWRTPTGAIAYLEAEPTVPGTRLEYGTWAADPIRVGDSVKFVPTPDMLSHGLWDDRANRWVEEAHRGETGVVSAIHGGTVLWTPMVDGGYTIRAFELISGAEPRPEVSRSRRLNPHGFTLVEELPVERMKRL